MNKKLVKNEIRIARNNVVSDSNVKSFSFSTNENIVDVPDYILQHFNNIEEVYFGNNPNLNLEKTFFKLRRLKKLKNVHISNNVEYLPITINGLVNLKLLDLRGNKLENIDYAVHLDSLKQLLLSNNDLGQLEDKKLEFLLKKISLFPNLEILDISSNYIDSLPISIEYNKNIKYLNIKNNDFKFFPVNLVYLKNLKFLEMDFIPNIMNLPNSLDSLKDIRIEFSSKEPIVTEEQLKLLKTRYPKIGWYRVP
jgi:Leucine-rich repeat (LRR) protein